MRAETIAVHKCRDEHNWGGFYKLGSVYWARVFGPAGTALGDRCYRINDVDTFYVEQV